MRRYVNLALAATMLIFLVGAAPATAAESPAAATPLPVSGLKIMSYYPADAGWSLMWSSYSHDEIAADFGQIASLGANTVRIIVPPTTVGYPTVKPDMLAHFDDVIDTAAAAGLHVQLTLFDMWGSYSDISGSQQWLRSLLVHQANNPTIALVELRNEMPLTATTVAWARAMLPFLSTVLPGVPRTLSVPAVTGTYGVLAMLAVIPASMLDVVDVHYYGEPAAAASELRQVVTAAGGRPVIVGETGMSTDNDAAGEQAQSRFFAVMAATTNALHLPVAAPWILSDFTTIPSDVWASPAQYFYGLRHTDGTWKPAAAVVRAAFLGGLPEAWDGGFEHESTSGGTTLGSWITFDAAEGKPFLDRQSGRGGSQSLCFAHTGGTVLRQPSVEQSFPVLNPGATFRVSGYVRRTDPTGVERIALAAFDPNGRFLGQVVSAQASGSGDWQQLTVSAAVPANVAYVQVHLKTPYESGQACWDDIDIQQTA